MHVRLMRYADAIGPTVARIETKHCPNSTDAGGQSANHYVKDGACVICDRSIHALAHHYGL